MSNAYLSAGDKITNARQVMNDKKKCGTQCRYAPAAGLSVLQIILFYIAMESITYFQTDSFTCTKPAIFTNERFKFVDEWYFNLFIYLFIFFFSLYAQYLLRFKPPPLLFVEESNHSGLPMGLFFQFP